MRAVFEEPMAWVSAACVALSLGLAYIFGGIGAVVVGAPLFGAALMLTGCYVAAGSLVALRDGAGAWPVFAPAAGTASVVIFGLTLSGVLFPA